MALYELINDFTQNHVPFVIPQSFTQPELLVNPTLPTDTSFGRDDRIIGTIRQVLDVEDLGEVFISEQSIRLGYQILQFDNTHGSYILKYYPANFVKGIVIDFDVVPSGLSGGNPTPSNSLTCDITLSSYDLRFDDTATATFTFNEVPTSFTLDNIYPNNFGSFGTITATSDPKVFTSVFTPYQNNIETTQIKVVNVIGQSSDITLHTYQDGYNKVSAIPLDISSASLPISGLGLANFSVLTTLWLHFTNLESLHFTVTSDDGGTVSYELLDATPVTDTATSTDFYAKLELPSAGDSFSISVN